MRYDDKINLSHRKNIKEAALLWMQPLPGILTFADQLMIDEIG